MKRISETSGVKPDWFLKPVGFHLVQLVSFIKKLYFFMVLLGLFYSHSIDGGKHFLFFTVGIVTLFQRKLIDLLEKYQVFNFSILLKWGGCKITIY